VLVLLLVLVLDAFDPLFDFEDEYGDEHDLKILHRGATAGGPTIFLL
jgi:hypothetical protein